ncbi:MAG: hypothetical protein EOP82_24755 [Variovorax sp.]|nr:MAG: hypothetical protein EOP82_24755 [Variovorax sp.]
MAPRKVIVAALVAAIFALLLPFAIRCAVVEPIATATEVAPLATAYMEPSAPALPGVIQHHGWIEQRARSRKFGGIWAPRFAAS